jgi:hypothetical protein
VLAGTLDDQAVSHSASFTVSLQHGYTDTPAMLGVPPDRHAGGATVTA